MRAKVEIFIDLDAVAADASGALDRDAQASLYDSVEWFRLTVTHVLPTAAILVVRARVAHYAAWLFLRREKNRHAQVLGSWYSLRFAPVFAGAPDPETKLELLTAIARALKRHVDRVTLSPIASDDLGDLQKSFGRAGWLTRHAVQTQNWIAHTADDDFEAYWARRPRQLRNTVKRKALKAGLAVRLLDRFDDDAWDDYERVFAASWKGEEGSPAFLRALARQASDWGALRLALGYDASGGPLAAQFWTVDGSGAHKIATIHKLAYADAERARSPGSVLGRAMFAHVLERDHPAMIDFGTGDDAYKADWMDEKRPLYRFEAYRPTSPTALVAYARALVAARRTA